MSKPSLVEKIASAETEYALKPSDGVSMEFRERFQEQQEKMLTESVRIFRRHNHAVVEMVKEPSLEAWIEHEFSGYGMAVRNKDDPPITGEPLMSMAVAKELTRRAVRAALAKAEGRTP